MMPSPYSADPVEIPVPLASGGYPIFVAPGGVAQAGAYLRPYLPGGKAFVVADANVSTLYATIFCRALNDAGIATALHIVSAGEASKDWHTLAAVCEFLLAGEIERGEAVVALGGGVVGDLAGFAAAITKRGCAVVQVPTTLLAQVDSSVGGKNAINTPHGKNLVGAFHQPACVLIDPDVLASLPHRQMRAGYAEVVKYGLIDDPSFFAWCEAQGALALGGAGEEGDADSVGAGMRPAPTAAQGALVHAIATSVRAKARIVGADERETKGVRALLNLGHTFGHAVEAEGGYDGRVLHGEGVAVGLALAFAYSAALGLCPQEDADRVARHLASVGLPTRVADTGLTLPGARFVDWMRHDKKKAGGALRFVLARGIGQAFLTQDVDLDHLAAFLDSYG